MITGIISGQRALIPLLVRGPAGLEAEIEFVLDTGFVGFLTLPASVILALSLPFLFRLPIHLADGSRALVDVHDATVLWDGEERLAEVLSTRGEPLLGMSLLDGSDVYLQVTDGGVVTIEAS